MIRQSFKGIVVRSGMTLYWWRGHIKYSEFNFFGFSFMQLSEAQLGGGARAPERAPGPLQNEKKERMAKISNPFNFIFATQCRRYQTLNSFGKIFQVWNIKCLHHSTRCKDLGIRIFEFVAKTRENSEPGKFLTDYHIW